MADYEPEFEQELIDQRMSENKQSSPLKALGSALGGALALGVASMLGKAMRGFAMGAGKKMFKQFQASDFGQRIENNFFYQFGSKVVEAGQEVFKKGADDKKIYKEWHDKWETTRKNLNKTYYKNKGTDLGMQDWVNEKNGYYKNKFKSFYRNDRELISRVKGGATTFGTAVVMDLVTFHIMDKYIARTKESRDQTFLQSIPDNLGAVLLFKGFKPVKRAVQETGVKGINAVLKKYDVAKYIPDAVDMANRQLAKLSGAYHGAERTFETIANNNFKSIIADPKAFLQTLRRAPAVFRDEYRKNKKAKEEQMANHYTRIQGVLHESSKIDAAFDGKFGHQRTTNIIKTSSERNAERNYNGRISHEGLGLKNRAQATDSSGYYLPREEANLRKIIENSNIEYTTNKKAVEAQLKELRELSAKGLNLKDQGIYNFRGRTVDTRFLRLGGDHGIGHSISTKMEKLLTIGNIKMLSIFQIPSLTAPINNVKFFGRGKTMTISAKNMQKAPASIENAYTGNLMNIEGFLYDVNMNALHTNPKSLTQLTHRMTTAELQGQNPLMKKAVDSLIKGKNYATKELITSKEFSKHNKFMRFIVGTMDGEKIFEGNGPGQSFISRILGWKQKLVGSDSPLNFGDTTRQIKQFMLSNQITVKTKDGLQTLVDSDAIRQAHQAATDLWRMLGNMFDVAENKIMPILKDNVFLESLGLNTRMSNTELYNLARKEVQEEAKLARTKAFATTGVFKEFGVESVINEMGINNVEAIMSRNARNIGMFKGMSNRENMFASLAMHKIISSQSSAALREEVNKAFMDLTKRGNLDQQMINYLDIYAARFRYADVAVRDRTANQIKFLELESAKNIIEDLTVHYKSEFLESAEQFANIQTPFRSNILKSNKYRDFRDVNITRDSFQVPSGSGIMYMPSNENPWDVARLNDKYMSMKQSELDYFMNLPETDPAHLSKEMVYRDVKLKSTDVLGSLVAHRFSEVLGENFLGLDVSRYDGFTDYMLRGVMARRVLPISGALAAFNVADKVVAATPMLNWTPFDNGIVEPIADTLVAARRGIAAVNQVTGVRAFSSYLEGLMPGSINSPLGRAGRIVGTVLGAQAIGGKINGTRGKLVGGAVGLALSVFQGGGFFDITESYSDITDEYAGRKDIAYKKGRGWLLGATNLMGGKIETFTPNAYARMKSHYRGTDDMLGGIVERLVFEPWAILGINPIGNLLDPGHYAKKKQYSYPAPRTGSAFQEVPFIGPILGYATNFTKLYNGIDIRKDEWQNSDFAEGLPEWEGSSYGNASIYSHNTKVRGMGGAIVNKNSMTQTSDEIMYKSQEFLGMWGFSANALMESVYGRRFFENQQVLETGDVLASKTRQYWDQNLGDLFASGEGRRRATPRSREGRSLVSFNPLTNAMPDWMPAEFQIGNVLTQMPLAEIRTPGSAYEAIRDVDHSLPMNAEYLGMSVKDTTRYLLGLYKKDAMQLYSEMDLTAINETSKAKVSYDSVYDIDGDDAQTITIDGKRVVSKTINLDRRSSLVPTESEASHLNWLMHQNKTQFGQFVFMKDGQAITTRSMNYDQDRFQEDMGTVLQARGKAMAALNEGKGFSGQSYSHLDRLKILGDIAPMSAAYEREKQIVNSMSEDPHVAEVVTEVERRKRFVSMKHEMYPYRFKGNMMETKSTQNLYNLNESIKDAAEYSGIEKVFGNVWERLSHMNTPINSKVLNYRSPLEDYERSYLHGRDLKLWEHPIDHFIKPYIEGFRSADSTSEGAIAGATAGFFFGGMNPALSLVGGAAGAIYGTAHWAYSKYTGETYIPERVQKEREVNRLFDRMKYERGNIMYDLTGDKKYLKSAKNTMTFLANNSSMVMEGTLGASSYKQERPYMKFFMWENSESERKKILSELPSEIGTGLTKVWADHDFNNPDIEESTRMMAPNGANTALINTATPDQSWSGYTSDFDLNDIKYSYVNQRGMDNFSFGLGYVEQARRVENQPGIQNLASQMGQKIEQKKNAPPNELKREIDNILNRYKVHGVVMIQSASNDTLIINNG